VHVVDDGPSERFVEIEPGLQRLANALARLLDGAALSVTALNLDHLRDPPSVSVALSAETFDPSTRQDGFAAQVVEIDPEHDEPTLRTRTFIDGAAYSAGRSGTRQHLERAHHLVVFMLEDMAVPEVAADHVEGRNDSRDLAGVGDDRVLLSGLPGIRGD